MIFVDTYAKPPTTYVCVECHVLTLDTHGIISIIVIMVVDTKIAITVDHGSFGYNLCWRMGGESF